MTQYETVIAAYLEAWNATDPAGRLKAIAAALTEEGTYTDPFSDVQGHEALAAVIAGTQKQFPGFVFRQTGTADGHHDLARFAWELVAPDGSAPIAGTDVIRLDGEGRIRTVLGFVDRLPTE